MKVHLIQVHPTLGLFGVEGEVHELPNGDLFVGEITISFPKDSGNSGSDERRFSDAEAQGLRRLLSQQWGFQTGRGLLVLETRALGTDAGRA